MNVVVPRHGLGWVEAYYVGEREQELLVETERLGLYLDSKRIQLDLSRFLENVYEIRVRFRTFLSNVGHRLRSLELRSVKEIDISAAFDHCSSLEHLSFQYTELSFPTLLALSRFLRSPSAYQLQSLNLNGTLIHDAEVVELAVASTSTTCLPRLRELRIHNRSLTAVALEALSTALSENRTIRLVELRVSLIPEEVQRRLDDKHRCESVRMMTLPLAPRLAFVSVFSNKAPSVVRAGNIVEWGVFELIFEFAGYPVERTLLWTI